MATHKKDVPAWTRNRVESIQERLDNLEKIAENLNGWVSELRRGHDMIAQALEQLAGEHPEDVALALARLNPSSNHRR